ncbi:aminotransferase class I/II-fold pyridoxal phosphate-dependent enzyme [bacterium]|nr:aminotransferase class I/II-fold pyridoxal phosphate-dependent enzyme [bacterium]
MTFESEASIPLLIPQIDGNEERYLRQCVETNFVSTVGPFVEQFEQKLAEVVPEPWAVATSSGTAALHLALAASGVSRDDLVIVPSYSFIATANAISYMGASPWFIDIEPTGWTMDPDSLRRLLHEESYRVDGVLRHKATDRRVAAILAVDTLGIPVRLDALSMIASEYDLPLVVDSAAALGGGVEQPSSNIPNLLRTFSFNGNKTFTCGGGGAVVGYDAELRNALKHLSTTARLSPAYEFDRVGYNYRLTNVQAAIGCAQLERYDEFRAIKRRIFETYRDALADLPGLAPFPDPEWARSSHWLSGVVSDPGEVERLESLRNVLLSAGIDAREFWRPIHNQKPYLSAPRADLSVSENLWRRVLPLPSSTSLSDDAQLRVIETVRKTWR